MRGQQYVGQSGMIHVPTADMDTAGVARVGLHYIPKEMMPDQMLYDNEKFNSLTNYLSLTAFRWVQVSYGYTLWKMHRNLRKYNKSGFYSKDRYFSLKFQPIREDQWWPSVVIGGNDVWGASDGGESGSNYYRNYYIALSKHVTLGDQLIGGHVAYRKWKLDSNRKWDGVVGGITVNPSFYRPLRLMCEWDGNEVNVGADCRLFKYFLVQCAFIDMHRFNAGLSLYINLL
jgi:hypothetical protein